MAAIVGTQGFHSGDHRNGPGRPPDCAAIPTPDRARLPTGASAIISPLSSTVAAFNSAVSSLWT